MSETRIDESPRARFLEYCSRGELGYQVSRETGQAFFYPRVIEPITGRTDLEWRVSKGTGTVYASTTVRPRGAEPHNVSIVELDEGFRLMSTVTDREPDEVRVGMRVRVIMAVVDDSGNLLPTFVTVDSEETKS